MNNTNDKSKTGRSTIYNHAMKQTAIYLPDNMIVWLDQQPKNRGETIRDLIARAMSKADHETGY